MIKEGRAFVFSEGLFQVMVVLIEIIQLEGKSDDAGMIGDNYKCKILV